MNTVKKYPELPTMQTVEFGTVEVLAANDAFVSPIIVEKSVITRLSAMLDRSSFKMVKENFKDRLRNVKDMEDYVELLQDELSFHRSVNLLTPLKEEFPARKKSPLFEKETI